MPHSLKLIATEVMPLLLRIFLRAHTSFNKIDSHKSHNFITKQRTEATPPSLKFTDIEAKPLSLKLIEIN